MRSVVLALSGTVVFLTLFEILRTYSIILYRDRDLLISRIAQYAGLGGILGLGLLWWPDHCIVVLGLAVSGAFAAAYAALRWRMRARPS